MAIADIILKTVSLGNAKMILGSSTISGGTDTGDVTVPLTLIFSFQCTINNANDLAVSTNETFPLKNTAVTIITEGNDRVVNWVAVGI